MSDNMDSEWREWEAKLKAHRLKLEWWLERMGGCGDMEPATANEVLREIRLAEALQLVTLTCENVHHPKGSLHAWLGECPVVARISSALAAWREGAC